MSKFSFADKIYFLDKNGIVPFDVAVIEQRITPGYGASLNSIEISLVGPVTQYQSDFIRDIVPVGNDIYREYKKNAIIGDKKLIGCWISDFYSSIPDSSREQKIRFTLIYDKAEKLTPVDIAKIRMSIEANK